jgi:rRNA maturation protein Nop10
MVIEARFSSACPNCGQDTAIGERVNWVRGSKATHLECPTVGFIRRPARDSRNEGSTAPVRNSPLGIFTVVMPEGRRTLKFKKARQHEDRIYVSYMTGSDNESSYTYCGKIQNGRFSWAWETSEAVRNSMLKTALNYLLNATDEQRAEAGLTYALESNHCYKCGKRLTVPASVCAGVGPVCSERE